MWRSSEITERNSEGIVEKTENELSPERVFHRLVEFVIADDLAFHVFGLRINFLWVSYGSLIESINVVRDSFHSFLRWIH